MFFVLSKGYRCVPLKNGYSENMELASLLVHIDIRKAGVSEHAAHIYTSPLWVFMCIAVSLRKCRGVD